MVERRKVPPEIVQAIWDGIRSNTHQRIPVTTRKLANHLQKIFPDMTTTDADQHIIDATQEKHIVNSSKNSGILTIADDEKVELDSHDWYCIECHQPGDVVLCTTCPRVFHLECHEKVAKNDFSDLFHVAYKSQKKNSHKSAKSGDENKNAKTAEPPEADTSEINQTKDKVEDDPLGDTNELNSSELETKSTTESSSDETKKIEDSTTEVTTSTITNSVKADEPEEDSKSPKLSCSICFLIKNDNFDKMSKEQINYIATFILLRIKNWLPLDTTDKIGHETLQLEEWQTRSDNKWRSERLIYLPMDIPKIEFKSRNNEYNSLAEIHADILTIRHNVAIFHGVDSPEVEGAQYMLVDAYHDITEIKQCVDCYRHSNEKKTRSWFCFPCDPPHELVWAKQKGFCYWPAKVIRIIGRQYDVRFFGAKYMRAMIDKNFVKPIETTLEELKIKKSQAFNKAHEELLLHQHWLKNPQEITTDETADKVIAKRRSFTKIKTANNRSSSSASLNSTPTNNFSQPSNSPLTNKPKSYRALMESNKRKNETPESKNKKSKLNDKSDETEGTPKRISPRLSSGRTSEEECKEMWDDIKKSFSSSQDDVISSTQDIRLQHPTLSLEGLSRVQSTSQGNEFPPSPQLSRNYNNVCEELRLQLEVCTNRGDMIKKACDVLQSEMDKLNEKIRTLNEQQASNISMIKKKQWCYNCEEEAIYHCCWNTSYCSIKCQQSHWHEEHKRNCRRKRN